MNRSFYVMRWEIESIDRREDLSKIVIMKEIHDRKIERYEGKYKW